ncbi:hypothetical protein CFP65_0012 [Kitasatospora sp. MMS16-BH015]|uniref:FAD-dependent monooxygenase n=1 Tax=Kitasatospora sp. MMS16-BH015 TaxID=2018025 RepID=UPI000CA320E7|nr:FAD-dependent monooxygenase [Kitasatospora sp. MMS16-BH015]AUG75001.1 hypothetical protein CFP65_0012 [Kitasatospora sp. MMS16-BH015]
MNTETVEVLVVGAGGAGLTLATELALAGVSALVLDQRPGRDPQSRAGAIQPRTAEVLQLRGLLEEALQRSVGRPTTGGHFAGLPAPLDYSAWDTRHPYPVSLPQDRLEAVLEERLAQLGGRILRLHRVVGLHQDGDGATVTADTPQGPRTFRGRYLAACDGAHSGLRKLVGAAFPGQAATLRSASADLVLSGPVDDGADHISGQIRTSPAGHFTLLTPLGGGLHKLLFSGPETALAERDAPVTADEVRAVLKATHGPRVDVVELRHASRFSNASRQLERYRHGRVFFAGDSAHIHLPAGGQGLNLGVQDAFNLGWKLAAVLRDGAGEQLLDTYHTERHPVAARVITLTRAQGAIMGPQRDGGLAELREVLTDLIRLPEANRHLAGMMSGLDLRYPMPQHGDHPLPQDSDHPLPQDGDHPLLGLRMPDLDLTVDGHPVRFSDLTRTGKGVLLELRATDLTTADPWNRRITRVRATVEANDTGPTTDTEALLVRPDGYVCWAGGPGLTTALNHWFGPATT